MAAFNTPGVYIQEIPKLPASIAPVATAIPAFIGYTKNVVADAKRISSMTEFVDVFGGPAISVDITVNGPNDVDAITNGKVAYRMYYALELYFGNGGGPCWIISSGQFKTSSPFVVNTELTDVLNEVLVREDEPTIIYFPDAVSLSPANYGSVMNAALSQCETLQDRFVIMDLPTNAVITTDSSMFRNNIGTSSLKYGASYYPWVETLLVYPDSAVKFTIGGGAVNGKTLDQAITDAAAETPPTTPISEDLSLVLGATRAAVAALVITMPPGGAVAGIYARVDRTRGVWHAPANISINLVSAPTIKINDLDQENLNVDPTGAGKSINAIRNFTGKGTLIWGARTLAGNDNEWRYVPVRRLFLMMEESISKATEFVVFEPNDANTWVRTKTMIENFLTTLWRQGALAGAKPQDAFFVKVGLGETMSAQDILEGNLIIEIGVAAVRPAEFIILRFSHKLQVS